MERYSETERSDELEGVCLTGSGWSGFPGLTPCWIPLDMALPLVERVSQPFNLSLHGDFERGSLRNGSKEGNPKSFGVLSKFRSC